MEFRSSLGWWVYHPFKLNGNVCVPSASSNTSPLRMPRLSRFQVIRFDSGRGAKKPNLRLPMNQSGKISHRYWIPIWTLILAGIALYYVNSQTEVDRNFRIWLSVGVGMLAVILTLLWLILLSRFRWWFRVLVVVFIGGMFYATPRLVRVEQAVDGRGLPRLAWRSSPTKEELLNQRLAQSASTEPVRSSNSVLPVGTDFPQFLGPDRRNSLTDIRLKRDWKLDPPRLLWRQPIGLGWSSFSVSAGRAITQEQRGNDELVTCYEVRTGRLLWAHTNHVRFAEWQGGDGPRATPTIVGESVYASGGTGILDCLDLQTGTLRWSHDVLKETGQGNLTWGKSSSPLVYGDIVITTGGTSAAGPALVAYRVTTGELAWTAGKEPSTYASPVLGDLKGVRQIISLNAKNLAAYDPATGSVLWEHPWQPEAKFPKSSQPVLIGSDRIFVSAGYGMGCALFKVSLGADKRWTVDEVWKSKSMKTQFNNVSVLNDSIFGLDDGFLACVSVETGERRWKDGRFGSGQSLLVDDLILVQTEPGPVVLVEANRLAFRELGEIPALSSKTWNNPALAAPFLLVRNDQEAACYELAVEPKKPVDR
jgi:outer membrane protein assembly factor BamB